MRDGLIAALFPKDPYDGFPLKSYSQDINSWHDNRPSIQRILEKYRPQTIAEVGSWKGQSAIFFADTLLNLDIHPLILCIDTWLGSLEHWNHDASESSEEAYQELKHEYGYPTLYRQFIANVLYSGMKEYIVPFPATSVMAAKWLKRQKYRFDCVFIDGSHEPEEVSLDLKFYSRLLTQKGFILGDDFKWPGVKSAVIDFMESTKGYTLSLFDNDEIYFIRRI
jgi:cephalosporin hydroxylase